MSRGGGLRRFGAVEDDQSRSAQAPDRAYARQLDGERSAAALRAGSRHRDEGAECNRARRTSRMTWTC